MAGPQKVLVVDDESKIVRTVRAYLEREGYLVSEAGTGPQALEAFKKERPDLVVLDLMLPELDGYEVCRRLRRESDVPVIMLTARDDDTDKLIGLELGADDYVTKPFSPRELVARVRAVLRRTARQPASSERFTVGDLVVDEERFEVSCHGQKVDITPTEFKLLATLARRPGRVFTRAQLVEQALGESFEGYERTIDAHIKNLRRKLGGAGGSGCGILTVHGVGYKLEEPPNG